jgi:hypothetical protein
MKKINVFNRKGSGTLYALSGFTMFPFASMDAFTHAGGDESDIVELDDNQFYKYAVMEESPIIKLTK